MNNKETSSNRLSTVRRSAGKTKGKKLSVRTGGRKLKSFIQPMLATLSDKAFTEEGWIFETKWDGYRAIAKMEANDVQLYSRNGLSFNQLYPEIVNELKTLSLNGILDGEIVVLEESGKSNFQRLQQYDETTDLSIRYIVFDCLSINNKSLIGLPLLQRKQILKEALPKNCKLICYSEHVETDGESYFQKMAAQDLEGMIAKKSDSLYEPGKRTKNWLKIKNHNTQEAIIVGFTPPKGSRSHFGSLILAVKSGEEYRYVGNTGTGFTNHVLEEVYQMLQPLKTDSSPFDRRVPLESKITWVRPKLVCQIKYTELTRDGIMRHPVFEGLRLDKSVRDSIELDQPLKHNLQREVAAEATVALDGRSITITNKNKLYWEKERISKSDVVDYYYSIHEFILPYFIDRPQSLRRNPNGISQGGFFQKEAGKSTPSWVKTVSIYAESSNREINYILCNDTATLAYLNNLGCIEFNTWNSRVESLDHPDYLVLDLDPSDKNTFDEVIECAIVLKSILDTIGCSSFCKTSGSRGLHVYVPLASQYHFEEARSFAQLVAQRVVSAMPSLTTIERALKKRNGKIYIDFEQNRKGQTVASVYSLRPRAGAPVSTPLIWDEVAKGLNPLDFNIKTIPQRLQQKGDLFRSVLSESADLNECLKKLKR